MRLSTTLTAGMLLAAMALVSAEVALQLLEPNPNYPDSCYDPEKQKAYPLGSSWDIPGQCVKASCGKHVDDDKYVIQFIGCGKLAHPKPPCKLVQDRKAAHPACCTKVVCP